MIILLAHNNTCNFNIIIGLNVPSCGDHKMNQEEREINIEPRFFGSIIGFHGHKIQEIRDKFNYVSNKLMCIILIVTIIITLFVFCFFQSNVQVQLIFPIPSDEKQNVLKIRGHMQDVNDAYEYLEKFHDQLLETSYSIKVSVCKIFHKNLIGKGGAHINRLRQETSTRIHVPNMKSDSKLLEITGSKPNVEKARDLILKFQQEQILLLMDEIENREPRQQYLFPCYRLANLS